MRAVAKEAQQLSDLTEDEPDAQQILARLDQLERLMAKLMESASGLSEGQFKEFLNSQMAEAQGHHPDIFLTWGLVKVTIWTHKIDGLTESDFVFAAKTDQLVSA